MEQAGVAPAQVAGWPGARARWPAVRAVRRSRLTLVGLLICLPIVVLAVIGAVVGEFISSDAGLGYLINRARYDYDTPLVFVAILMLALIARAMYGVISLLEGRALGWQARSRKN